MELKNLKTNVAELKTSRDATVARVCFLAGMVARIESNQTGKVQDANRRVTADQSFRLDAVPQELAVSIQASQDS